MLKKRLEELLLTNSYIKIQSNIDNILLFSRKENDEMISVGIFDYSEETLLTIDQYVHIRNTALQYISKDGKKAYLLTVVLTKDITSAKKLILPEYPCWIIDCNNNRLLLFENQKADFFGIRELVEKVCDSSEDVVAPFRTRESLLERGKKKAKDTLLSHAPVNLAMFIINIAVYVIMLVTGSPYDLDYMLDHGVMYVPYILNYDEYYRLFTCLFIHFGIQHLIGNMVALFFLGDNLERAIGKVKYLIIFLFSGLVGSVGSFVFSYIYNRNIMSAGASGAIYGIIGALLWIVIREKGHLENMTTFRVLLLVVYAVYSGLASQNVDNAAHISGMLAGFLASVILYRRKTEASIDFMAN